MFSAPSVYVVNGSDNRLPVSLRRLRYSTGKWIANMNPSQALAVVYVFGPEHITSQFCGGLDHHCVPELYFRLLLQRDRGQNIICGRSKTFHVANSRMRSATSSTGSGGATLRVTVTKNSCSTCTLRQPVPSSQSLSSSFCALLFAPAKR